MLIKLIEEKMSRQYPFAEGISYTDYYLVDTFYRDGSVSITTYDDLSDIPKNYLLTKDMYVAKDEPLELMYETETRPCGECECFHEKPYKGWPTCQKIMFDAVKDGKICYPVKEGSCFEDGSDRRKK